MVIKKGVSAMSNQVEALVQDILKNAKETGLKIRKKPKNKK